MTHFSERDNPEYLEKEKEYDQLNVKAQEIDRTILLTKDSVAISNKIDLRTIENDICTKYYIFLHETDICIGEIGYRGYHNESIFGDVGYSIYEEYRGNNYAYEALLLLSNLLLKNGIDSFIVTVNKNNIPSIKIIEKYGGLLLGEEGEVLKYECKTVRLSITDQQIKTM